MITEENIEDITVELIRKAETILPDDVIKAITEAYNKENDEIPKTQLKNILENINLSKDTKIPMCQDTGVQIFFVWLPKDDIGLTPNKIKTAIENGVSRATTEVPLRPNTVHPLTRKNAGDNTGKHMPYINFKTSDNDYLEFAVLPKGAGSENMSALKMLTPAQGIKGIKEFVLDTVVHAGGKPCSPIVLGIGIGGSADIAMKLGKEALLRPIDEDNVDPQIAELEIELINALNDLGIGPMGLGGKISVLGVNIEYAHCHTASHPVGINIQCWASRRARAKIYIDGNVEYGN